MRLLIHTWLILSKGISHEKGSKIARYVSDLRPKFTIRQWQPRVFKKQPGPNLKKRRRKEKKERKKLNPCLATFEFIFYFFSFNLFLQSLKAFIFFRSGRKRISELKALVILSLPLSFSLLRWTEKGIKAKLKSWGCFGISKRIGVKWGTRAPPTRSLNLAGLMGTKAMRPRWCWTSTTSPLSTITPFGSASESSTLVLKVRILSFLFFLSLCYVFRRSGYGCIVLYAVLSFFFLVTLSIRFFPFLGIPYILDWIVYIYSKDWHFQA